MKITTKNYFDTINKIGFENLPLVLKQSHTVILTKTINGEDWSKYQNEADLKRMIDLVFKKLEEFMVSNKKNLSGTEEKEEKQMEGTKSNANKPKKENPYSKIGTEIKFIHRFLAFHDKILYKNTFEIFIDELQKAIQKKEITKKSPVAKDIIAMQNAVINAFNTMKNAKHFVLKPETIKRYKTIIEKYENAYDEIDDEPTEKKSKRKPIALNGITQNNDKIMSSMDFANMEFSAIGLKDKWLEFIGDPAPGFTAMVYGRPKMGKSYLCVDFANYLAINHGKVLYISKEEFMSPTFAIKLKDKDATSANMDISGSLPTDLSSYQFVFIDSVTSMKLTPDDLQALKSKYPKISFVYVFQVTKAGAARGTNEYMHNVDVVIEVPEKGIAIQNGRFNQGGEMRIFDNGISGEGDLSGIGKVKKKSIRDLIVIKSTFSVSLEEFDFLMERGESVQEAIRANKSEAERWVQKLVEAQIKKGQVNAKVDAVYFMSNDDEEEVEENEGGFSYYDLRLSGLESELRKITGKNKDLYYDWKDKEDVSGIKNRPLKHNLTLRNNVSMLDGNNKKTMKKTVNKDDWTEPKYLNAADWGNLKTIKKYCDKGDYKSAMNHAMNCDTVIREEIPPDVWKKMGGQLTKTGEDKLKAMKQKSSPKIVEQKNKKSVIVFNHGVRILKGVIEREWDLELTDADYIEILDIAQERCSNLPEVLNAIHDNLSEFLTIMKKALNEWDKKTEKSVEKLREKFDPKFYANRKDDENPAFIFSLISSKLLAEALQGDFDLIYLVRRELANRGQDSKGKWIGFDEAKKLHRVD
jgi:hypothetical protein